MTSMSLTRPSIETSHIVGTSPLRVGAVTYLNSKPLIEGLSDELSKSLDGERRPAGRLQLDYPSRLADQLAERELDVALIPSVEALCGDGYSIISDACVAARGPVRSVKLYSRVPAGEIRSLALDEGSRTSAALTRTILSHRYGVEPDLRPFPLGSSITECDADALLMIGDRAMTEPSEPFVETWDLGEHWYRWTGRPFVFAVWAARTGVETEHIAQLLSAARDRGVAAIPQIAERAAASVGTTVESAESYLRRNLHFYLSSAERASLKQFQTLAHECGVI